MSVAANAGSPALVVQVVEAKAATNDDHAVSCPMLVHNCRSLHHSAWFVAVALRSRGVSCALSDSNTKLEGGLDGTLSLHQPQTPDPGVYATLHSSDGVCSAPADHSLLPAKPLSCHAYDASLFHIEYARVGATLHTLVPSLPSEARFRGNAL
jgi:hypothetical protein